MLIEIRSEKFRTTSIRFGPSLNVVLGDENATNSIGKSTLLMVIDFAFGGDSLLKHNKDIVKELGEHDYFFTFQFGEDVVRFRRGTSEPSLVYACNDLFEPERFMEVEEYTALLKRSYDITLPHLTFRGLVGLYLRVWGKENLRVERPLHAVPEQKARECVDTLLKVFGRYETIHKLSADLDSAEKKIKTLRQAKKQALLPAIGKRQYTENQRRIEGLEAELADIRTNLAQYATNLSEVVNKEVLQLKDEKDRLLALRLTIASRLQRVSRNLTANRSIRKESFRELVHFFPEVNEDRLARVEDFHSDVARLLKAELIESVTQLQQQLQSIDQAITHVDDSMARTLASVEQPVTIVDRVVDVSRQLTVTKEQNELFETDRGLQKEQETLRTLLVEEKQKVLSVVQAAVNDGMGRIVRSAFGEDRKSPRLSLNESSYSFEVPDDTGTGTAYASLVVLDLTVFLATELPVVSHDTILFKNIENDSVANLINIYLTTDKQSFIALDEIHKYGETTAELLEQRSVIRLDDSHVLYIKDWRTKRLE